MLKEGDDWELRANYINGSVRLFLTAKSDRREFPGKYLGLNETEWNRLVRWVEYQRAEEALKRM
jgi:hypothetical protein